MGGFSLIFGMKTKVATRESDHTLVSCIQLGLENGTCSVFGWSTVFSLPPDHSKSEYRHFYH